MLIRRTKSTNIALNILNETCFFRNTHQKNCEAMINDSAIAIFHQAHAEMG